MAKEDFCFTYYDGDAARDKAHMNRLERGAYDDLIGLQRKVGAFTQQQAEKILGKDFAECWPSMEIVLRIEDGKYYIDWLKTSIEKTRAHSKKQKSNAGNRWNSTNSSKSDDLAIPNECQTDAKPMPLEDGDGNEDVLGNVLEEKKGAQISFEPSGIVPEMVKQFNHLNPMYPMDRDVDFPQVLELAIKIQKWKQLPGKVTEPAAGDEVKRRWGELIVHIKSDPHFSRYSLSQINKHFQSIILSFTNGTRTVKSAFGQKPSPHFVPSGGFGKL